EPAGAPPVPDTDAFESAMQSADDTVDALARDTERAAQLQACQHEIDRLRQLRTALQQQIAELIEEQNERRQRWQNELQEAGLPALSPSEVRDWQAVLDNVLACSERIHTLQAQLAYARELEHQLSLQLRTALSQVGHTSPAQSTGLDILIATATDLQENLR